MTGSRVLPVVFMLLPAILLGALAMDIYLPSIPSMPKALNTDHVHIQQTLSIYMFTIGVGQILFGPIADKIGRKKTMIIGLVIYNVGSLLAMVAMSVEYLLFGRFLQAFGACGAQVAAIAMVRDLFNETARPRVYSYLASAVGIAPILAPMLGAYLVLLFGSWRASFAFLLVFGCVTTGFVIAKITESYHTKAEGIGLKKQCLLYLKILRNREFVLYSLCNAVAMSTLFLFFSMSSIILITLLGTTETQFGYYFGTNALIVALSSLISPEIVKSRGIKQTVCIGCGLILIAGYSMVLLSKNGYFNVYTFLGPMYIASMGIGLISGPASAGALKDFGEQAGMAAALVGVIRFMFPAFIGSYVMRKEVTSTLALGKTMSYLGAGALLLFLINSINLSNKLLNSR